MVDGCWVLGHFTAIGFESIESVTKPLDGLIPLFQGAIAAVGRGCT